MNQIYSAVGVILAAIVLIVVVGMIMALPVMWLWNGCLVGAIAGVSTITWLQAWGISILCGFLFKTSSTETKKS